MFSKDSSGVLYAKDPSGNRIFGWGTTKPADGDAGWAKGAFFVDTDVAAGTTGLYVNIGDTDDCEFDPVVAPDTAPSAQIVAQGEFTTAGGDANETIPVTGCLETDYALVSIKTNGATPRTLVSYDTDAGSIGVVMSGDPSTDHVLSWMVFRPPQ